MEFDEKEKDLLLILMQRDPVIRNRNSSNSVFRNFSLSNTLGQIFKKDSNNIIIRFEDVEKYNNWKIEIEKRKQNDEDLVTGKINISNTISQTIEF